MTNRPLFLATCLTVIGWGIAPFSVNGSWTQEEKVKKVYSEEDVRKFYEKGKEEGRKKGHREGFEEGRTAGWWQGFRAGQNAVMSGGANWSFGGYGGGGGLGWTGQTAGRRHVSRVGRPRRNAGIKGKLYRRDAWLGLARRWYPGFGLGDRWRSGNPRQGRQPVSR